MHYVCATFFVTYYWSFQLIFTGVAYLVEFKVDFANNILASFFPFSICSSMCLAYDFRVSENEVAKK